MPGYLDIVDASVDGGSYSAAFDDESGGLLFDAYNCDLVGNSEYGNCFGEI